MTHPDITALLGQARRADLVHHAEHARAARACHTPKARRQPPVRRMWARPFRPALSNHSPWSFHLRTSSAHRDDIGPGGWMRTNHTCARHQRFGTS